MISSELLGSEKVKEFSKGMFEYKKGTRRQPPLGMVTLSGRVKFWERQAERRRLNIIVSGDMMEEFELLFEKI